MAAVAPIPSTSPAPEFTAASPSFHIQEETTVAAQAATARIATAPVRRHVRSTSPHLLLVANANSSGLAARPELIDGALALLRRSGGRPELRKTSSLDELAAAVADERRIVLMGGDGSLHAAANLPGPKPEFALIPAGKANNVARSLGIPTDIEAAARLAVTGAARSVDAIAAVSGERSYLAVEGVSVGFHAIARSGYSAANSADTLAGIKVGLGALANFGPLTMAVERDGALEVLRTAQLFAVNFPLYGPGLQVSPDADVSDGLLDLVTLEANGRAELLRLLAHVRRGTHLDQPGVRLVRARRIRIASGGRSPVIADTTNMGTGTVELTVVPGALNLVGGSS
jgi:diacylglycerol kinase family enzyme